MKAKDVVIGATYRVKVGCTVAEVKITRENPHGGWDGRSVATGKTIRIKSPQRLRGLVKANEQAEPIASQILAATPQTPDQKETVVTTTETAPTRSPRTAPKRAGTMSCLDAAAKVLAEEKRPMTCGEIYDAMDTQDLWTSPGGKTPQNTLYSAITREIARKREGSRFAKAERGKFTIHG